MTGTQAAYDGTCRRRGSGGETAVTSDPAGISWTQGKRGHTEDQPRRQTGLHQDPKHLLFKRRAGETEKREKTSVKSHTW